MLVLLFNEGLHTLKTALIARLGADLFKPDPAILGVKGQDVVMRPVDLIKGGAVFSRANDAGAVRHVKAGACLRTAEHRGGKHALKTVKGGTAVGESSGFTTYVSL